MAESVDPIRRELARHGNANELVSGKRTSSIFLERRRASSSSSSSPRNVYRGSKIPATRVSIKIVVAGTAEVGTSSVSLQTEIGKKFEETGRFRHRSISISRDLRICPNVSRRFLLRINVYALPRLRLFLYSPLIGIPKRKARRREEARSYRV